MAVVPDFAASENLLELKRMNADKLLLAEHTHTRIHVLWFKPFQSY